MAKDSISVRPVADEKQPLWLVLLVEPDTVLRNSLNELLRQRWTVFAVPDNGAALLTLRDVRPHLVLAAAEPAEGASNELLHAIRASEPNSALTVVLYGDAQGRAAALSAGADDYLPQSMTPHELWACVGSHLALARHREEASKRERALRAELEALTDLRDSFLAIAAHELRTPLTSLIGQAQLLRRRLYENEHSDPRHSRSAEVVAAQAQRLNRLISNLFDLSYLDAKQLIVSQQPVGLTALVDQVVAELTPTLSRHTIMCHHHGSPAAVLGDTLRLEQVIYNLINNAVKYSPAGGPIHVSLDHSDGAVCLRVRDNGIGIPAPAISQLFQRFYRAPNAMDHQIVGMGVGLYLVREILARHGGTVEVESVEGQGSEFTARLPAAASAQAAERSSFAA